jgi:capsule biosynthesis phosphatase
VKRLIIDLDDTICRTVCGNYRDSILDQEMLSRIIEYKNAGFEIVIHTSRNVRSYSGNIGKITAHTLPVIVEWLNKHSVPYDEIYIAKPWCGNEGFYVDDRSVRPSEFKKLSHDQILNILNDEKK